jgi:hypothetical protein
VHDDEVVLLAKCRGDAELEQWTFQRKKGLFEELSERVLTFAPESVGPDEFDAVAAGRAGLA